MRNTVAVLIVLHLIQTLTVGETTKDQAYRYIVQDGAVVITAFLPDAEEALIPGEIDGMPVTGIDSHAFRLAYHLSPSLKRVTIPRSVTRIGAHEGVRHTFAQKIFAGSPSLLTIDVEEGNTVYASVDGVLMDAALTTLIRFPPGRGGSYTIPDGIRAIDWRAFNRCVQVESVTIPDEVETIGDGAFSGCDKLSSVSIGNGITTLPRASFSGCESLVDIQLGENIHTIESDAFSYCDGFQTFTIPEGVVHVGDLAFRACQNLKEVTIPSTVTKLWWAFSGCSSLTAIHVDPMNATYGSIDGVLCDASLTELLEFPEGRTGSYTIPQGVERVGETAFSHHRNLTEVTASAGLTTIGRSSFYQCRNLTRVTLPEGVVAIHDSAFSGCEQLAEIHLPQSITIIGKGAFGFCRNLNEIELPAMLNRIEPNTFNNCTSLETVTIPEGVTSIGWGAFANTGLTRIHFPASVAQIEFALSGCFRLMEINVAKENPAYLSRDGVLFNREGTVLIQFPGGRSGSYSIADGIERIDPYAFAQSYQLERLVIPSGVTTIGTGAFYQSGLDAIYFFGNPPDLGDDIFKETYGLEVYFSNKATGWGQTFVGLRPPAPFEPWGSYPILRDAEGQYVDTGSWLGWLEISNAPLLYAYPLGSWLYMAEPAVNAPGAWVFAFR
jgi:hypothetical protein